MEAARLKKRQDERREKILAAARHVLAKQGFDGLSLRGIARRLKMAPAAIYFYFKDKEAIVRALCDEGLLELSRDQAALAHIEDPTQRLFEHGLAYLRFARRKPDTYRILFMEPTLVRMERAPDIREGALDEDSYAMATELCRRILRQRKKPLMTASQATHGFWALIHGLASLDLMVAQEPWFDLGDVEKQYRLSFENFIGGLEKTNVRLRAPLAVGNATRHPDPA